MWSRRGVDEERCEGEERIVNEKEIINTGRHLDRRSSGSDVDPAKEEVTP